MVSQLPDMLKLDSHQNADATDRERADEDGDDQLDPISGHGTFIAGILEQVAPGQIVEVASVLSTQGEGSGVAIAKRIDEVAETIDDRTVLNMSFGSYGDLELSLVAAAVRRAQQTGAVVVASAGNDSTCAPSYPAALPGVISVGSIEPHGRAHYSNFGNWIRACAPGTGVISAFFRNFNGDTPPTPEGDPDDFKQWARWTGTSFAAPIVAAVLMRHIALHDVSARDAVANVIDDDNLLRLPGLGTVVNVVPGQ